MSRLLAGSRPDGLCGRVAVCFVGGLPWQPRLRPRAEHWRGLRACKVAKIRPIYLVHYNIWESSIKTMVDAEGCHSGFTFTNRHKASVPSEWIMDRPQIIQDNRMGYVICMCVCVLHPTTTLTPSTRYLTTLLAHLARPRRTNCLL